MAAARHMGERARNRIRGSRMFDRALLHGAETRKSEGDTMNHYPEYDAPRNPYDEKSDDDSHADNRNLYWEMQGRNSASIQSKDVLEDLAQSTACETAYLRTLTGLIATNNQARAELASVIAPARPQIEAVAEPMPRVLREPEPLPNIVTRPARQSIEAIAEQLAEPMRRRAGR
jgi:hypothetical protein